MPGSSRRPSDFCLLTYRTQNSDETVVKPAAEFKGGLYYMQNGRKSRSVQKSIKKKKKPKQQQVLFKHKANPHEVFDFAEEKQA